ncbi:UNVERIFIED_CONTAM: hypothetical protein K2H54_017769 [Gekko kuhli]
MPPPIHKIYPPQSASPPPPKLSPQQICQNNTLKEKKCKKSSKAENRSVSRLFFTAEYSYRNAICGSGRSPWLDFLKTHLALTNGNSNSNNKKVIRDKKRKKLIS